MTTIYDYPDDGGRVWLRKRRFFDEDGKKQFRMQARSREGHTWVTVKALCRKYPEAQEYFGGLLYGGLLLRDELTGPEHGTVYWSEGEKDADSINALYPFGGVIAVSHWQGAGSATEAQAARLRSWRGGVVVCVDEDDAGAVCGWSRYALLRRIGIPSRRIRVVRAAGPFVPGSGRDVTDHLNDGYDLDDLVPVDMQKLERFAQAKQGRRLRGSGSVVLTPTPRAVTPTSTQRNDALPSRRRTPNRKASR